ncbi:MAG TPA: hypothetical protein VGG72_21465 [Bryobacteraceae bacterium]|jgi:hypothetical protein
MSRAKSINFPNTEGELSTLFDKLQRNLLNKILAKGTLAIHGSASTLVKTTNAAYLLVDGVIVKLAAADLTALVGTVVNATFNVFVFTVNAAGTVKVYMGTAGSTLAGVVFPTTLDGESVLGFIIVNPTGTGNFVGGTTALDDGTVAPNVVYFDSDLALAAQFQTL